MRGVSSEAVKKAILGGRLVASVRKKENGKYEVNPDAANIEWDLATNHKHRPKYKNAEMPPPTPRVVIAPENLPPVADQKVSLFEAQRRHEEAKARMAELKLHEMEGTLVSSEGVKDEAFKIARAVRDSLLGIPDRVSGEFAGITQAHEIHARLTDEIRKALEGLQV